MRLNGDLMRYDDVNHGKHMDYPLINQHKYGTSHILWAMFNSYVNLPEGTKHNENHGQ